MRALILAAGVSRRLYPLTYNIPKSMLNVGDRSIIEYQLESLGEYKITDITMIVGYYREKLMEWVTEKFPQINFDFLINQHFFETNTAYSVYLAREQLRQETHLLMNADVLYPRPLIKRVLDHESDSTLAVEVKQCGREEVKVVEGATNRIVAIGKELIQENSLGEFIGVAKLSRNFNQAFAESLDHLIDAGGKADYLKRRSIRYWKTTMFIMLMYPTCPASK